MSPRTRIERLARALAAAALTGAALAGAVWAHPVETGAATPLACAVVSRFEGVAQILDASRTRFREIGEKNLVSCGSWISVDQGWVALRHRDGYVIRLGPHTFAQFVADADPVVLFRGEAYAQADDGMGELRIVTPNGRARFKHGSGIVLFDTDSERTQLIGLDGKSGLENRFEPAGRVTVGPGELSAMDFRLVRVLPSVPRAVSITSLKDKLAELHLPPAERERAVALAWRRASRKFVAAGRAERAPASSARPAARRPAARRPASTMSDEQLRAHLVDRVVAGQTEGEKILFPNRYYGKTQRAHLEVTEIREKRGKAGREMPEDAEKKKLIEELSAIKVE